MKVTFDANTWARALTPEQCNGEHNHDSCLALHEALQSGRIRGYFSEAVVTLDALKREEKVDVVGSARIASETHSTGPRSLTISVGWRWNWKQPTDQRFWDRIGAARILGVRALVGPRRLGDSLAVQGFGNDFYEPCPAPSELVARVEKIKAIDMALGRRGLGRARAVNLGIEYSTRDGKAGELWAQGLGRARNAAERKKVWRAINEWADGEAIAAHVGYGNDFFCTHDFAGGSDTACVFHASHRNWLTTKYDVKFVTLPELVALL